MTDAQIIEGSKNRIEECYEIAETYFNRQFIRPQINFDLRGNVAGQAFRSKNKIKLNLEMAMLNGEKFVLRTPAHEAAHLIVHYVYGLSIRPHGNEWKQTMTLFGISPERCHNYIVPNTFVYVCNCKIRCISKKQYKNMNLSNINYICTYCNTQIKIMQDNHLHNQMQHIHLS
jgi:SprT protein